MMCTTLKKYHFKYMKESLKTKLHEYIKAQAINLEDLYRLSRLWGCKTSTLERYLRDSMSPEIQEIKTPKGAIIGYKWRGTDTKQLSNVEQFMRDWPSKPATLAEPGGLF